MPYAPTTWVEGVTKLGPTNMNHIESGIAAAIPADIIDAKGDLIAGTADNAYARVAVGANGLALVADSVQAAGIKWLDLTTVLQALSTYDAKGDLIVGSADNAAARLAVGSPGQALIPDSAQAVGMKWAAGGSVVLFDSILGAPAANFDATALAGSYSSLHIELYLRSDTAAASTTALLRFNGDAGANYDREKNIDNGVADVVPAEQFAQTSVTIADVIPANTAGANLFGVIIIDIPFYAGAVNNKIFAAAVASKIGVATGNIYAGSVTGAWRSNVAITQVTIIPGAGNWNTGSRMIVRGQA